MKFFACFLIFLNLCFAFVSSFQVSRWKCSSKFSSRKDTTSLKMLDLESDTVTYAAMFALTMIPSLAFVKFVGDQADKSRGNISEEVQ